ncbi:MAG: O-antigen ligase family protein [Leptospira sp.]|nr:O-antigen ligase family protein [Leptospira sp.]
MLLYIPLTILIFASSIISYRYSFPYPVKEYAALFLFLFSFGFIPSLLHRIWGRIFVVIGALVLIRIGSFSGILITIPEWTTLHPLFFGAIAGISVRELFINKTKLKWDRFKYNPELWFILFLFVLAFERFMEYHPWSFANGVELSEGFYYAGLSYRQAFQLTWMLVDNLVPILYYFFVEHMFSRENENPAKDWIFGLSIAFMIQSLVLVIQNFLIPTAFMQDTGMSLDAGRSAGLFQDSGSASWMYPTMGLFLFWLVWRKRGQWLERNRIVMLCLLFAIITINGIHLGRTFLLVFIPSIAIFGILPFWNKKIADGKLGQNVYRISLILMIVIFSFSILWFGENQKAIPSLSRASIELKAFIVGDQSLEKIDSRRTNLMASSWELFKSAPAFGVGLGSMIVHLKDPTKLIGVKPSDGFVDSPANFYLGWLGEVGILGTIVLGLFVILASYLRDNRMYLFLLVLPLMTGFQIVHSDGAFFVLFIILGSRSLNQNRIKLLNNVQKMKISFTIISIGIALHFIVWTFLKNS